MGSEQDEFKRLSKQCNQLADELKTCIATPGDDKGRKIKAIRAKCGQLQNELQKKYDDLNERLRKDFSMEKLLVMRAAMQEEKNVLTDKNEPVDYYIPQLTQNPNE